MQVTYALLIFLFYLYLNSSFISFFFFFNDTATTEIYTLSLHDALPISSWCPRRTWPACRGSILRSRGRRPPRSHWRSEEHTSELQSQSNLVCRLLLEKKKKKNVKRYNKNLCNKAMR